MDIEGPSAPNIKAALYGSLMFGNVDGISDLFASRSSRFLRQINDHLSEPLDPALVTSHTDQTSHAPDNKSPSTTQTTASDNNNGPQVAPLSKVLPTNLNGKTVFDLFPNFRPNETLVFSKLFCTKPKLNLAKSKWALIDRFGNGSCLRTRPNMKFVTASKEGDQTSSDTKVSEGKGSNILIPAASSLCTQPTIEDYGSNESELGAWPGVPAVSHISNAFDTSEWYDGGVAGLLKTIKKYHAICPVDHGLYERKLTSIPPSAFDEKRMDLNCSMDDIIFDPDDSRFYSHFAHTHWETDEMPSASAGWIPSRHTKCLADYRAKFLNSSPDQMEISKAQTTSIFPNDGNTMDGKVLSRSIVVDSSNADLNYISRLHKRKIDEWQRKLGAFNDDDGFKVKEGLSGMWSQVSSDGNYDIGTSVRPNVSLKSARPCAQDTQLGTWLRNHLRHINEAYRLNTRLFPTYLSPQTLRNFERPLLRRIPDEQSAYCFMTSQRSNFVRNGGVYLCEYMEEFPIVLNQPGMGMCLRNYERNCPIDDAGKARKDINQPEFGSPTVYLQNNKGPTIGTIPDGHHVMAFECNLFKAYAAYHRLEKPYYLILSTRGRINTVYRIDHVFLMGQQFPQIEIPAPNSKRANLIKRDFLQSYIYRQFTRYASNQISIDPSRPPMPQGSCKIRLEDIKRCFPYIPEAGIRKRLKHCAVFSRGGGLFSAAALNDTSETGPGAANNNAWYLKEDFQLPSEEEIRKIVTPEQCCSWYSMLAAEQRLTDRGILDRPSGAVGESVSKDTGFGKKIQVELQCAPWNSSKTYLECLKHKCELTLDGDGEPTCIGAGFFFCPSNGDSSAKQGAGGETGMQQANRGPVGTKGRIKSNTVNKSATGHKKIVNSRKDPLKKPVPNKATGNSQVVPTSNIDRLPLKKAKQLLAKLGIKESIVRNFSRWETIQFVKALTSKHNEADNAKISSFVRALKSASSSPATVQVALKQLIREFAKPRAAVSSATKAADDKSAAYQLKIQKIVERQLNFLKGNLSSSQLHSSGEKKVDVVDSPSCKPRVLTITRVFVDPETKEETCRSQEVEDHNLIDEYIHIRSTMSIQQIKQLLNRRNECDEMDGEDKGQQLGREPGCVKPQKPPRKKRIAVRDPGQIRKRKGLDEGGRRNDPPVESEENSNCSTKFKCGACGGVGHMRTNRECPAYTHKDNASDQRSAGSSTNWQNKGDSCYSLKQMSSTKMVISRQPITRPPAPQQNVDVAPSQSLQGAQHHEPLTMKIPKALVDAHESKFAIGSFGSQAADGSMANRKLSGHGLPACTPNRPSAQAKSKKRKVTDCVADWPAKSSHRRRVDPLVSLSTVFENILNNLRELSEAQMFLSPVSPRDVPDYHKLVSKPMDLQTIRQKAINKQYENRETFLRDMKQIVDNSVLYNGTDSSITLEAYSLFSKCVSLLVRAEDQLITLEKKVNPLLDDDDSVVLCFILDQIFYKDILKVHDAWEFMKPVSKQKYPEYYKAVTNPIDLENIRNKITNRQYKTEKEFLDDLRLMHSNCVLFNGENSYYAETTRAIISVCQERLAESPHRSVLAKGSNEADEKHEEREPSPPSLETQSEMGVPLTPSQNRMASDLSPAGREQPKMSLSDGDSSGDRSRDDIGDQPLEADDDLFGEISSDEDDISD